MKKLILNDSRQIEIQSAQESGGVLRIRIILTTAESLKALFQDKFATKKMTMVENQQTIAEYENYTEFKYIKEVGGIFEVELTQSEADLDTRVEKVENEQSELQRSIDEGFAEITMILATITGGDESEV